MNPVRRQIGRHPAFAAMIIAAAIALRALIPAGFMPDFADGRIGLVLCTDVVPAKTMAMSDMGHGHGSDQRHPADHHGKSQMPCGFGALSSPGLNGSDPLQLALATVVIVTTAVVAPQSLVIALPTRLRPPLRGPPTAA